MDFVFKARAKRSDNKNWVYGYAMVRNDGTKMLYIPESNNTYSIDSETIGFCSNINDVNGAMIYDGDIVRITSENGSFDNFESTVSMINNVPFCVRLPKNTEIHKTMGEFIPIGMLKNCKIEVIENVNVH